MMLRYTFGESEAADAIEKAVDTALTQARTPDIYEDGFKKVNTSEMGDLVAPCFNKANILSGMENHTAHFIYVHT